MTLTALAWSIKEEYICCTCNCYQIKMGGKKKGGGKAKKAKGEDNDTKAEQKRIIDEIHTNTKEKNSIEEYPMK